MSYTVTRFYTHNGVVRFVNLSYTMIEAAIWGRSCETRALMKHYSAHIFTLDMSELRYRGQGTRREAESIMKVLQLDRLLGTAMVCI